MEKAPSWLDEVVLVNESNDERVAGDLTLHRSEDEVCLHLEAWWVEQGKGFAFSASGLRLVLGVGEKGEVIVAARERCAEGPEIVLGWLRALAERMLELRNEAARDGRALLSRAEEQGVLPETVEGLIAYVGLPPLQRRDWFAPSCLLLLATIAGLLVWILVEVV